MEEKLAWENKEEHPEDTHNTMNKWYLEQREGTF